MTLNFGIGQSELPWGDADTATGPDIIRIAQEVKALGATSIRMSCLWSTIDPQRTGNYKWTLLDRAVNAVNAAGLDILLIIEMRSAPQADAPKFGPLCGAIAQRYGDKIRWYEIGNEVNQLGNSSSPHDPSKYIEFLRPAYNAIMAASPTAMVFAGALMAIGTGWASLSPIEWTQGFVNSGGHNYCHAVSMHPYMRDGRLYTPRMPTADNWSLKNIVAMRGILDKAGATSTLIACTEFGYESMTSPSGLSTTVAELEAEQAANIATLWGLIKSYADAGMIYATVWPFSYRDWQEQNKKAGYHYGIVHFDYAPKPAKDFIKSLAAPWDGNVTDTVGISDTAGIDLRPSGLYVPNTDSVGLSDSGQFDILGAAAQFVSVGGGAIDHTSDTFDVTISWPHAITAQTKGALVVGLVASTDHSKPWSLYSILSVSSSIDGAFMKLGSIQIATTSNEKGSIHLFGLVDSIVGGVIIPKIPTAGTHTISAEVKTTDGVTKFDSVAGDSVLAKNIGAFGTVSSAHGSSGGNTPDLVANSGPDNLVIFLFGGSNTFNTGFTGATVQYQGGNTLSVGKGGFILIATAPGALTVEAHPATGLNIWSAIALDCQHA